MPATLELLCYLGAAAAFIVAALGGTRRGAGGQPATLVPIGLLLWMLPTLWAAAQLVL